MVTFTSLTFILRFLTTFLFVYYLFPKKFQNTILFIGSLIFYGMGQWKLLPLLLSLTIINFFFGNWLVSANRKGYASNYKKLRMIFIVGLDVAILVLFKILALNFESVALPLGISFYSFKMISFQVDCYSGKIKEKSSFMAVAAYFSMFPQITQGPIMRYDQRLFAEARKFSLINLERGMEYFCLGFGMKVLLADRLGILWNEITKIGFDSISTPLAWMGVYGYSFELYFDFWGYSLMAAGLGVMLGFPFIENFQNPYGSKTVGEFYRRWHISLGTWFRDYIYFPLGGSRTEKGKVIRNLLIVWLITGLWHGGTINFLIWGLVIGLVIVLEKFVLKSFMEKHGILGRILVLVGLPITWIIFAIDQLPQLGIYFSKMFGISGTMDFSDAMKYGSIYWSLFVIGFVLLIPKVGNFLLKEKQGVMKAVQTVALLILFLVSLYFSAFSNINPFLYYSF